MIKNRLKIIFEIILLILSIIIILLSIFVSVNIVVQEITTIIITITIWKLLKNKSIKFIGITNIKLCYKDLTLGLIMGSLSMVIVFLITITVGGCRLSYSILNPVISSFIISDLVVFVLVGFAEEIFCRGYIISMLNKIKNKYIVSIISSMIFAFMHILNPNVTVLSLINIFLVGLLFCYMRFKFENIWVSIGYHITWNYFEGTVFGFEVSGITQRSIYKTQYIQPNIINGGFFGPEGGLAVTVVIILAFIILLYSPKIKINRYKFFSIIMLMYISLILQGCDEKNKINYETETTTQKVEQTTIAEQMTVNPKDKFIDEMIESMSIEQKVGQLFMVAFRQTDNSGLPLTVNEDIINMLNKYKVGGFIMFQQNIDTAKQTQKFINDLQSNATIPLFIGIDEEGGSVSRLQSSGKVNSTKLPTSQIVGNKNDTNLTYSLGNVIGSELYALGFNMNFAPVADVNTNPDNPVIGNRAFSSDAGIVAKMVASEVSGIQAQNVSSVIKHFPGHGDTKTDTHKDFTYVESSLERLEQIEFIPFEAGINAGADGIMVSHIALPNVTDDNLPSSLSKFIISNILRQKLQYNGIVITDALNMNAITLYYNSDEAALMAIEAGADILLMPDDLDLAYKSLCETVKSNTISEKRIDESLKRIFSLKYDRNLFSDVVKDETLLNILGCDEHKAVVNKFYDSTN